MGFQIISRTPFCSGAEYAGAMLMTKFAHSCVRLEQDGRILVLDPGSFSEVPEALDGAAAVLITHEHADHLDQDRVLTAMVSDPALSLHAPATSAQLLREAATSAGAAAVGVADRIHTVESESTMEVAGFRVRTFGGQHALIHPHIPMVANVGYLIEESLYHPGDSFIVPDGVEVQNLLVPLHAPWSKTAEVIDFVIAVRARQAFPIHDALLTDAGRAMVEMHVSRLGGHYGTQYQALRPGQSVEL